VAARTHLQIATLLLKHAKNVPMAKNHLQEAVSNCPSQDSQPVIRWL